MSGMITSKIADQVIFYVNHAYIRRSDRSKKGSQAKVLWDNDDESHAVHLRILPDIARRLHPTFDVGYAYYIYGKA